MLTAMLLDRYRAAALCGLFVLVGASARSRGTPNSPAPKAEKVDRAAKTGDRPAKALALEPRDLHWQDAPPPLPPGAKVAILDGNPKRPGPFSMRLGMPAGYKLPPHTHPADERVTVLSGEVWIGLGQHADMKSARRLGAGSYYVNPRGVLHFVLSETDAVLQVTGVGPWGITFNDGGPAESSLDGGRRLPQARSAR